MYFCFVSIIQALLSLDLDSAVRLVSKKYSEINIGNEVKSKILLFEVSRLKNLMYSII